MSHDKYENDTILTSGARAWHMLDENQPVVSFEEVKDRVHNYQVFEKPLIYFDDFTGQQVISDKKITYRVVTDKISGLPKMIKLGEVGKNYTVLQPAEHMEILEPIAESGLVSVDTAGTLLNGTKGWVLFKLNEIEPVPGDRYDMYLMAYNSFDGSSLTGFCRTCVRVVCHNTWKQALNARAARILSTKHTRNVKSNLEEIREALSLASDESLVTEQKLKRLAEICVQSEEQILKVVKVVFTQKDTDNLESIIESKRKSRVEDDILNLYYNGKGQDIPGVEGTGLALFNAITEYTNHVSGSTRKNASTADSRLNSVLFGSAAKINDKAAEAILQLA